MRRINAVFSHAPHVQVAGFQEKHFEDIQQLSSIVLAVGLTLSGCSSESIQSGEAKNVAIGNRPPSIQSVRIIPNPIVLNQSISVQANAVDLDGDLITYRYQWRINGEPIADQTHAMLSSSMLKRGDRLSVEVTPYDGTVEGSPVRAESVVGNTPPEITQLGFEPTEVRVGERVRAEVIGSDADQDPIEYRFRWWRNNSEVADGDASELDTTGFAKGDTIVVEVTPSDPMGKGKSKLSKPVAILNSPPTITSVPPNKIERGRFVYAVTAQDPDGDPLTYALEMAPSGMKIDKTTGRIEWPLTAKVSGKYKVRVTATDAEEANAFQEFDLTLSAPASLSRSIFTKNFRLNTRLVMPSPGLLE